MATWFSVRLCVNCNDPSDSQNLERRGQQKPKISRDERGKIEQIGDTKIIKELSTVDEGLIILLETFKLELIPQQLKFHKVVTLARLHYEKYIQEGKVQEVQQDQEGPQEQTKETVDGESGSKDK